MVRQYKENGKSSKHGSNDSPACLCMRERRTPTLLYEEARLQEWTIRFRFGVRRRQFLHLVWFGSRWECYRLTYGMFVYNFIVNYEQNLSL